MADGLAGRGTVRQNGYSGNTGGASVVKYYVGALASGQFEAIKEP
jgi:hypothetical protein